MRRRTCHLKNVTNIWKHTILHNLGFSKRQRVNSPSLRNNNLSRPRKKVKIFGDLQNSGGISEALAHSKQFIRPVSSSTPLKEKEAKNGEKVRKLRKEKRTPFAELDLEKNCRR